MMNVLAINIDKQLDWALKCGNIRITGLIEDEDLETWLLRMIAAYAIDVVVFNEPKSKFFFGLKNKDYDNCLAKIVSVCEKRKVKCKNLSFDYFYFSNKW